MITKLLSVPGIICLSIALTGCGKGPYAFNPVGAAPTMPPAPSQTSHEFVQALRFVYGLSLSQEIELRLDSGPGKSTRIVDDQLEFERPVYIPSSREVAYIAQGGTDSMELKVVNLDSLAVRTIFAGLDLRAPTVSFDGTKIAFYSVTNRNSPEGVEVRVISLKTGVELWRVDNARSPAWSPIDDRLAFVEFEPVDGSPSGDIRILEADGAIGELAHKAELEVNWLTWTADGVSLLVIAEDPLTRPNLYTVNLSDGQFSRLTDDVSVYPPVAISPSGDEVAFVSTPNESNQVYSLRVETKELRAFSLPSGWFQDPCWSVDGDSIAVAGSFFRQGFTESALVGIDTASGSWHEVVTPTQVDAAVLWPICLP